jgi:hypothetical protein
MPQDNPRSESSRTETHRAENARAERSRSERSSKTSVNSSFAELGPRGITASLRLQREMLTLFSDIGQEWFSRATVEAEMAFKLPNKLKAARSMPDAFSAYQEWLGEWMSMFGEDSCRLVSDSRKIIDTGVRCFADAAPAATSL